MDLGGTLEDIEGEPYVEAFTPTERENRVQGKKRNALW